MTAVGATGPHTVRIWGRVRCPGEYVVRYGPEGAAGEAELPFEIAEGNPSDNTFSVELPGGQGQPIQPLTRYHYRVEARTGGRTVGAGRFLTAPAAAEDTPRRFAVAFSSCHQPFDQEGNVVTDSSEMLRAVRICMERHDVRFLLLLGDQMYADNPSSMSLFNSDYFPRIAPPGRERLRDCSVEEVRRLYQRRYQYFWNLPDWQRIQADYPCYMVLDDHDIVDNWGSDPAHSEPDWQRVGEGGRLACFDYQASRMLPTGDAPPKELHYGFEFGHTGVFIYDIRSARKAGNEGQLYSQKQFEDLKRFLSRNREKKILLIALSVPIVHLPKYLTRLAAHIPQFSDDFSDRWSSSAHVRDRDRFLGLLHQHCRQHPDQRLVLLSGDIHIGCVHEIRWKTGGAPFYQATASPITHTTGKLIQLASKALIRMNRTVETSEKTLEARVRLLPPENGRGKNPFGKLNLGIVEFETPAPNAAPRMRFMLYGHRGGEPECMFSSEWV